MSYLPVNDSLHQTHWTLLLHSQLSPDKFVWIQSVDGELHKHRTCEQGKQALNMNTNMPETMRTQQTLEGVNITEKLAVVKYHSLATILSQLTDG